MITVIASIKVKPEHHEDFLRVFKNNVPAVLEESGCIDYFPAVDLDASLPVQMLDETVVTVIEKWESLTALQDHLSSPHMLEYRKNTRHMVDAVSIKVLQQA